jgi:hypothetical protein
MWKTDPNTSVISCVFVCTYTHINMFPIEEPLEETSGGGKEEENDRG